VSVLIVPFSIWMIGISITWRTAIVLGVATALSVGGTVLMHLDVPHLNLANGIQCTLDFFCHCATAASSTEPITLFSRAIAAPGSPDLGASLHAF